MLTQNQIVEMMKRINFGDIDGYGDPNLDQYFLDNNYWDKIINGDYFYVSGRKGTGKSAIYRMIEEQSYDKGESYIILILVISHLIDYYQWMTQIFPSQINIKAFGNI